MIYFTSSMFSKKIAYSFTGLSRSAGGFAKIPLLSSSWRLLSSTTVVKLRSFSPTELVKHPHQVGCPIISPNEPPFIGNEWLTQTDDEVVKFFNSCDDDTYRVPPMAFARCSRGGKTRALIELAATLKQKLGVGVGVLYFSLNDSTTLQPWEQSDPVGALCRRIAFIARTDLSRPYNDFQFANVSEKQIVDWLGETPRVLLIDELNKLKTLSAPVRRSMDKRLSFFLRDNFLTKAQQYFVFSSHIAVTADQLSTLLNADSNRAVMVRELPLVNNIDTASYAFNWPDLTAREALYYGLVPALILCASPRRLDYLPLERRANVIRECIDELGVDDSTVRNLLASFITGRIAAVQPPLLHLMNTGKGPSLDNPKVIRWIPFHMVEVLKVFALRAPVSSDYKLVLNGIANQLWNWREAKEESGDAWESLFVAALLVRVASGQIIHELLPFEGLIDEGSSYTFSYDRKSPRKHQHSVGEYVAAFKRPSSCPHIAVYFPRLASFPKHDVIIAVYCDEVSGPELFGYQLKEGQEIAADSDLAEEESIFQRSFVIRGAAPTRTSKPGVGANNWTVPNKDTIDSFFGESGKHWTPTEWKKLNASATRERAAFLLYNEAEEQKDTGKTLTVEEMQAKWRALTACERKAFFKQD